MPQVSVAMAAYNAGDTVRQAVDSIAWQTLKDWELLIAEDGSLDRTPTVLAGYQDPRITVFSDGRNRGKPARMNELIDRARAPYLAIMDADDIAYPERLELQFRYLETHPKVDLLATGMATFDEKGRMGRWRRLQLRHDSIVARPWSGYHFNSPTWMGKTAWFRRHRYRDDLRAAEDEDLLLRAARESRLAGLDELLLAYRIDQWSWKKARRMRKDHVRALLHAARIHRDPRLLSGVLMHGAKLLREGLAVWSGREEKVLAHRELPLTEPESRKLFQVLHGLEEG